mgnify:CR=1 FL=1
MMATKTSPVALAAARHLSSKDETPAVAALRQRGLDHFLASGFDMRGREEWKYCDTSLFSDGRFVPGEIIHSSFLMNETDGLRLVFINGVFSSENSRVPILKEGINLRPLAGASAPGLGDLASTENAPLVALNSVFWSDGMLLELADGV